MRLALDKKTALCAALLALVAAGLFPASLAGRKALAPAESALRLPPWRSLYPSSGGNVLLSDQYLDFIPMREFAHENAARGRLPLWNPYLSCGAPFVAAIQAAVLFPLNLLLSPIDPFYSSSWTALVKLWFAGFFMMLYMRRLGTGRLAALFSAVAFSFSGFMVAWLGHPHANCAALLPALMYALESALAAGPCSAPVPWAGFALAYGCMLLGGHPPTEVHITLWLAAYFIYRLRSRPADESRLRWALAFLGAATLGTALAAPQLLPYLEYYRLSSTAASARNAARWSFHLSPATLTHFFTPYISGSYSRGFEELRALLGLNPQDNFNERAGYVGVLSLYLAAIAGCLRRGPARFYAAALLACLCVIYGLPPLPRLLGAVPVLNAINHNRLMLFVCFSLSAMAGLGLETVGEARASPRRGAALGLLWSATALVLLWLWQVFRPALAALSPEELRFALAQLPVLLAGAAAATALTTAPFLSGRRGAAFAVLWLAFDMSWFARGVNPEVARPLYFPSTPAIDLVRRDAANSRIFGLGWVLPADLGMLYGLQDARGQDFTTLRRYEELIRGEAGDFGFYTRADALPAAWRTLDVKYLLDSPRAGTHPGFERVYQGEISVFRSLSPAGRALVIERVRVVAPGEALARMRSGDFDPRREALLEEEPPRSPSPAKRESAGVRANPSATIVRYEPDEVEVSAVSPAPALLVLFDSYYPGWKATVNGAPAPLLRADYDFRAVPVPAGTSRVLFEFKPWSFRLGLMLAAGALAVLAAAVLV